MTNLKVQQIVKSKMEKRANTYLIKKRKLTIQSMDYGDCSKMQPYLLPNRIVTLGDKIEIFSDQARMKTLEDNTKGKSKIEYCLCSQEITNEQFLY